MAIFVGESNGNNVYRYSWRIEVFCEAGQETVLRAHRSKLTCDATTGAKVSEERDRTVTRTLASLPEGPRNTVAALASLFDTWEVEDMKAEAERKE